MSRPILADPATADAVDALSKQIITSGRADCEISELAHEVAEAQVELTRARRVRQELIAAAFGELAPERTNAASHPRRPAPCPIAQLPTRLSAIERYERRALSRRKLAIRRLDAARRRLAYQNTSVLADRIRFSPMESTKGAGRGTPKPPLRAVSPRLTLAADIGQRAHMKAALLEDRGVVRVTGEDARKFLNGLLTTDVGKVAPGAPQYAALLTPQGKIIVDFIIAESDGAFLLDCPRAQAQALAERLGFYKLRAKVTIENQSDSLQVFAIWDNGTPTSRAPTEANNAAGISIPPLQGEGGAHSAPGGVVQAQSAPTRLAPLGTLPLRVRDDSLLCYPDPRLPALGFRCIAPRSAHLIDEVERVDSAAYEAHRIALGVPAGGIDFAYGDAFPHEADMDQLQGVDFKKGCYVGQEVVSRMEHRATARTRVVPLALSGAELSRGTPVTAGGKPMGQIGSAAEGRALATLRLDRVADALAAGATLEAGGTALTLIKPAWARFAFPGETSSAPAPDPKAAS